MQEMRYDGLRHAQVRGREAVPARRSRRARMPALYVRHLWLLVHGAMRRRRQAPLSLSREMTDRSKIVSDLMDSDEAAANMGTPTPFGHGCGEPTCRGPEDHPAASQGAGASDPIL